MSRKRAEEFMITESLDGGGLPVEYREAGMLISGGAWNPDVGTMMSSGV